MNVTYFNLCDPCIFLCEGDSQSSPTFFKILLKKMIVIIYDNFLLQIFVQISNLNTKCIVEGGNWMNTYIWNIKGYYVFIIALLYSILAGI